MTEEEEEQLRERLRRRAYRSFRRASRSLRRLSRRRSESSFSRACFRAAVLLRRSLAFASSVCFARRACCCRFLVRGVLGM